MENDYENIIILSDEEFGEFIIFNLESDDMTDVFAIVPVVR